MYMRRAMFLIFLFFIMLQIFCSCNWEGNIAILDSDRRVAQTVNEEFLNAVQEKDKEHLKSMFSKNALDQVKSFDDSVEMLFNYCNGKVVDYDDGGGPFVETTKNENRIYQVMESSFTVEMDLCEYRFAMQFVTKGEDNEIGVTSIYVIKASDDLDLNHAYWGDGLFEPGIHVAVPNKIDSTQ